LKTGKVTSQLIMAGLEDSEPQDQLLVLAEKRFILNHDSAADKNATVKEMLQIIEENSNVFHMYS
jgi:hypothetical protein